jgi:hypothetical protein
VKPHVGSQNWNRASDEVIDELANWMPPSLPQADGTSERRRWRAGQASSNSLQAVLPSATLRNVTGLALFVYNLGGLSGRCLAIRLTIEVL